MSLRVSHLDGRVTLSVPPGLDLGTARAFLVEKADWVRGHLARRQEAVTIAAGAVLPVEGRPRLIAIGPGRGPVLAPDGLSLGAGRPAGPQAAAFLKCLARDRLSAACDRHAATLGRDYTRLSLRDSRSRWGSCSCEGRLMFSWRLAMAPPEILDYVAAHEVAHLAEMNHSPAFWSVVEDLCPDYGTYRGWLRREGGGLYRYRFEA